MKFNEHKNTKITSNTVKRLLSFYKSKEEKKDVNLSKIKNLRPEKEEYAD